LLGANAEGKSVFGLGYIESPSVGREAPAAPFPKGISKKTRDL